MRIIKLVEPQSGLSARCRLLDDAAPVSAAFLWDLAERKAGFDAIHAIWTGPEISVPMPASTLPEGMAQPAIPAENATSYPDSGDIVLAYLAAGSTKGLPPGDFYDIGLFYGSGGRLLMPFGWIQANVCARILDEDLAKAQADCRTIRRNGACTLSLETA
ncbi:MULTISPECIES: DUF3830 family protein [Blastomonas]|jgi:hypothetical protein|uniref:DUF3830 domain-containing protein n=1 Tax=Blastomonas fulva TaxID=1550728 RepID=A0ABN5B8P3_9SPHN|nr:MULTISPECIES: DUF3830 family protein [Blastomonas]AOG00596.1 hypothetical protein BSY18_647 [Blastomonas sp. RAC04]ASR52164.1 hypothetical protein B5J99_12420 [Blastomonas fulva]KPF77301.1 hypothetical protein IP68_01125 [Blastomonas sp. AAP25]MCO5793991.1 DUF3830 family protein [Blastomonas sp.]MDK2755305.1 DUF3830 family protein [Blastomonas fulva]